MIYGRCIKDTVFPSKWNVPVTILLEINTHKHSVAHNMKIYFNWSSVTNYVHIYEVHQTVFPSVSVCQAISPSRTIVLSSTVNTRKYNSHTY